jgi:hypothetical protein
VGVGRLWSARAAAGLEEDGTTNDNDFAISGGFNTRSVFLANQDSDEVDKDDDDRR